MRKSLLAVLLMMFVCPALVHAASIGGMTTAGQGKVAIGVSEDYIADKDLKFKSSTADMTGNTNINMKPNIEYISRSTVDVAYGILSGLDVYTKLGVADFKSKNHDTHTDSGNNFDDTDTYKGKSALVYGLGVKGVYEVSGLLLGADVQYLQHKNKYNLTEVELKNGVDNGPSSATGKILFQEWQVALSVGKKIGNFTPYVGGKYSDMRLTDKSLWDGSSQGIITNKMKAKDNAGVFLGTDYKLNENWKFNIEGRFIDETAFSGSVVFKF